MIYGSQGHMTEAVSNEFYFDGMLVAMIMNYSPVAVSYTHLDVYKRQVYILLPFLHYSMDTS